MDDPDSGSEGQEEIGWHRRHALERLRRRRAEEPIIYTTLRHDESPPPEESLRTVWPVTPIREGEEIGWRPRWPQLVSNKTKAQLLEDLAEIVHTPGKGDYARGFEAGVAYALLVLGINEAASPERKRLPVPHERLEVTGETPNDSGGRR